jgi:hypothetical protein
MEKILNQNIHVALLFLLFFFGAFMLLMLPMYLSAKYGRGDGEKNRRFVVNNRWIVILLIFFIMIFGIAYCITIPESHYKEKELNKQKQKEQGEYEKNRDRIIRDALLQKYKETGKTGGYGLR